MSTAAVSTGSIYQELQTYYHQRSSDFQQLGKALQSGDLAGAQQEFNAIQTLGQSGPFAQGNAFQISQRQQDFAAVGQALQSGDLAGAQQAFAQLQATFTHRQQDPAPSVVVNLGGTSPASSGASGGTAIVQPPASAVSSSPATGATASGGPGIVVNVGNVSAGEQITIGVTNEGNGAEQLTIGLTQPNQSPEQITLNLNQTSNQQIVLNLFNSATTSAAQGSGVSVTA